MIKKTEEIYLTGCGDVAGNRDVTPRHGVSLSSVMGCLHTLTQLDNILAGHLVQLFGISSSDFKDKQGRKPIRCEYCKISCQFLVDIN